MELAKTAWSHVYQIWSTPGMVWYGILEFNVPLDTVQVISETEGHFGDDGPEQ